MYYVLRNDQPTGPYPAEQIASMARAGQVSASSMVALAGDNAWSQADSIPALAHLFTSGKAVGMPSTAAGLPKWARLLIGYHLALVAVGAVLFAGASALDVAGAIRDKDVVPSETMPTIVGGLVVFGLTAWGALRLIRGR